MTDRVVLDLIEKREAAAKDGDWPLFRALNAAVNARGYSLANAHLSDEQKSQGEGRE